MEFKENRALLKKLKEARKEPRKAVAEELREARKMEKEFRHSFTSERPGEEMFKTFRNGEEYISALGGVKYFFDYIRASRIARVLDIGVGRGRGLHFFSENPIGAGLSFQGTGLTRIPEAKNVRLTSVEVLRGMPDASFGGVIALFSLSYSEAPELAVEQIDRVLIPGGAVKGIFPVTDYKIINRIGSITHRATALEFSKLFQEKGFDVALAHSRPDELVFLAVKPGGETSVPARELLDKDLASFKEQIANLGK